MAAILCGLFSSYTRGATGKWGYYLFTLSRAIVGAGESAMISLAYTIVDHLAPHRYKTMYMAAIMMAPPLGIAAGYGVSAAIVSATSFWQSIFFLEGFIVALFAVLCFRIPMHGYKIIKDPTLTEKLLSEETEEKIVQTEVSLPSVNSDTTITPTETTVLTKVT